MRFGCDTGGTFTDLVVDDGRHVHVFKSPTTIEDPVVGVLNALGVAAESFGRPLDEFLAEGEYFIHGTTRAINALITGSAARTALLCTEGHPDVLVLREGGRADPFDYATPYPQPLIPRALTFELTERIGSRGEILTPLDEDALVGTIAELGRREIEAVSVALLWSTVNGAHERRVGELLAEHLPGVPVTLSHQLSPALREYRRASSASIDASLKPLMASYLASLSDRLGAAGFGGRLMVVTSQGGMRSASDIADEPIHSIKSGPSMAPVAGRHFAGGLDTSVTAVVADTGGTTYDVSVVRDGEIPWTRESWIGPEHTGHMTGFPSVAVRSVGAGGGSIAWVDDGGLLRVGPNSAGSEPGPACYGRGGTEPTLTDACLFLGYIDPSYFLGGTMSLDRTAAEAAIRERVAAPLGVGVEEAADGIVAVATSNMVRAIEDVTISQGIDPRAAVLVGGGGAAGLNSLMIATALGCERVIFPEVGATMSAYGALITDIARDFAATCITSTAEFDLARVSAVFAELTERCEVFAADAGGGVEHEITYEIEGRYAGQAWEIQVPVRSAQFTSQADVEDLRRRFDTAHEALFAISDPESAVDVVVLRARVRCLAGGGRYPRLEAAAAATSGPETRQVYFADTGWTPASVHRLDGLGEDRVSGPAVVETPFTTIVLPAGAVAHRDDLGGLTALPKGAR
jgi:N-methylhydantoinase A